MDVHEPKIRSYNMSRVRSVDTKPELLVRKFLHSKGLRYSLHNNRLPGKPDLCFTKYKTVIFVNGCFWHGHENCKFFSIPATRTKWWRQKLSSNIKRDERNMIKLSNKGWNCIIVWECELKPAQRENTLIKIYKEITEEKIK